MRSAASHIRGFGTHHISERGCYTWRRYKDVMGARHAVIDVPSDGNCLFWSAHVAAQFSEEEVRSRFDQQTILERAATVQTAQPDAAQVRELHCSLGSRVRGTYNMGYRRSFARGWWRTFGPTPTASKARCSLPSWTRWLQLAWAEYTHGCGWHSARSWHSALSS